MLDHTPQVAASPVAPAAEVCGVRYWRQGEPTQNFGDFLTELLLARALAAPHVASQTFHLIGSVISRGHLEVVPPGAVASFWGCGLRNSAPLAPGLRARALFHGVRGPLSRDALGLPASTVLGDPGLLLPVFHAPPRRGGGGVLCVQHMLDPRSAEDVQAETGADRVVRAEIAPTLSAVTGFIDLIAEADFVLAGALHGAITACAYRRPFAYFDTGFVDTPFKWADFAASIAVPAHFAKTIAEGRAIYGDAIVPDCLLPPVAPILAAAPLAPRHDALVRALVYDGTLSAEAGAAALAALASTGGDDAARIDAARASWNTAWARTWGQ